MIFLDRVRPGWHVRSLYSYYSQRDKNGFDDPLDQFFHQRKGFAHENELRLVKENAEHFNRLIAPDRLGYVPEPPPDGMPDRIHFDYRNPSVIEQITITGDDYETTVQQALLRAGSTIPVVRPALNRVGTGPLTPYFAGCRIRIGNGHTGPRYQLKRIAPSCIGSQGPTTLARQPIYSPAYPASSRYRTAWTRTSADHVAGACNTRISVFAALPSLPLTTASLYSPSAKRSERTNQCPL